MKFYIVAELRESYPTLIEGVNIYNDYVSRKSMYDLATGICNIGYDCEYLGGMKELFQMYQNKSYSDDMIFINYNYGYPAQYKRVQSPALLELMNAKYSGADPFSALLINDKAFCKKILTGLHVKTASGYLFCNIHDIFDFFSKPNLNLPVVVKPNLEGSSLGIDDECFCVTYDAAQKKAKKLINYFYQVLIEEYIEGYECTVWMIGNKNYFPFIKPLIISNNHKYYFENKIFTLNDKANHNKSYDLPENILPSHIVEELRKEAKNIFCELGLRDYGRIDFRIKNNKIYFIEANALPIFSKSSEIGAIMNLYSLSYEDICSVLIDVLTKRLVP